MLEDVLQYEREAFLFLNGSHCAFFDQFMWLVSGKIVWIPLALSLVYLLFSKRRNWKDAFLIIISIAIVVTLCDQFASSVCKPIFSRFRPTHHPEFENYVHTVFGYKGGRYGFISSHAANAFGFATLTALIFKNRFYMAVLFVWASATAYSRIYLGVHFITDIIPGIIVGLFFGFIVYTIYHYILQKLYKDKVVQTVLYNPSDFKIFYAVFSLTILFITVVSGLYATNIIEALTIK